MAETAPAEELRAAAKVLRKTASKATPGPWRRHDTWLDVGGHTATVLTDRDDLNQTSLVAWLPTFSAEPWSDGRNAWNNAAWIALASPALAEPLAAWLEGCATDLECAETAAAKWGDAERLGPGDYVDEPDSARHALTLARLINGRQS